MPGYARPETLIVRVRAGETLESALGRVGLGSDDIAQARNTLTRAVNIDQLRPGIAIVAAVARPHGGSEAVRLIGLSLRAGIAIPEP